MADVIISGYGEPLPRPVNESVMAKIMQATRFIIYSGLTVAVEDIVVEKDQDIVDRYNDLQRNRVLDSIPEEAKKLGHFDFDPEISFEIQCKITDKQYHTVMECSNLVPLGSRTSYKR